MCITPAQVLVNEYFDKRRSTAFSVANLSRGAASLLMPPIVTSSFLTYGFTGGMLLMGAMSMHVFIGPALFRSVHGNWSSQNKPKQMTQTREIDKNYGTVLDEKAATIKDGYCKLNDETNQSKKYRGSILDWALLRDSWFLTFLLSLFFFNIGFLSMVYIVPLSLDNGYSTSEVLLVLSVYGISDIVGSLVLGLALDTDLMISRRYHVCYVMYIFVGITSILIGFVKSFKLFVIVIVLRGLAISVYSIRIPVLSDVVGDDRLASGIALSSPVVGLGNLLGPLIGGKINTFV